jgi:hypothetical protein
MGVFSNPSIVTDGLVFYLDAANTRCYSGSGLTSNALVGGIGATLVNGVGFTSANNGTFIFDGTNDYVNIQYPPGINSGSQITLILWAKWITTGTTTTTIQTIVDNNYRTAYASGPGSIGFVIHDRPDLDKALEWGASPGAGITRCTSTFQVGDGNWRFISGTNDGSTSVLFVDGIQSGLARTAAGIGDSQPLINIGRWQFVNGRYFNGNVSGLMIYNRALSASEILQNYNATRGRYRI